MDNYFSSKDSHQQQVNRCNQFIKQESTSSPEVFVSSWAGCVMMALVLLLQHCCVLNLFCEQNKLQPPLADNINTCSKNSSGSNNDITTKKKYNTDTATNPKTTIPPPRQMFLVLVASVVYCGRDAAGVPVGCCFSCLVVPQGTSIFVFDSFCLYLSLYAFICVYVSRSAKTSSANKVCGKRV
eukprot:NODE_3664_length_644_cov_130.457143_g2626_i0.p1 GENE.NODE_3664_length_644_cov_130.457143_g2626_i0~~NODE_3664_length_644_cov_130.457143_g2626_i0.p1  ORF type:complete len:203 (+),score=3.49 NODE_3664_length_644_cov_130.457143_g2626_i0:62-610(+)